MWAQGAMTKQAALEYLSGMLIRLHVVITRFVRKPPPKHVCMSVHTVKGLIPQIPNRCVILMFDRGEGQMVGIVMAMTNTHTHKQSGSFFVLVSQGSIKGFGHTSVDVIHIETEKKKHTHRDTCTHKYTVFTIKINHLLCLDLCS